MACMRYPWVPHLELAPEANSVDYDALGPQDGQCGHRVRFSRSPKWWGIGDFAGASTSSLFGEAVVVDLGGGRFLFALLKGYGPSTARLAFFPPRHGESREEGEAVFDRLENLREERALPRFRRHK